MSKEGILTMFFRLNNKLV